MDVGSAPPSKFSSAYQSGALSFEINSNGKKLISNCGYYEGKNEKLIKLSKSSATHSTLILDDNSSCHYSKYNEKYLLNDSLKIIKKDIVIEKDYWKIHASHDGYNKNITQHTKEKLNIFQNSLNFAAQIKF